MKKALKMIGMVVMTILMSVSFSSCGSDSNDDDPFSSSALVGTTWVRTKPENNDESSNSYVGTIEFISSSKLRFHDSWIEYGKPCKREAEWKYNFDPKTSSGYYLKSWSNYENSDGHKVEFNIKGNIMTTLQTGDYLGDKEEVYYKQ